MSNTLKILLGITGTIALLAIGFALGVYGSHSTNNVGGTSYDTQNFIGDVYQGMTHILMFKNGVFVGPINTSQSATLSGTTTLKCLKIYNGATTTASYYAYASGTAMYVTSTKPTLCP